MVLLGVHIVRRSQLEISRSKVRPLESGLNLLKNRILLNFTALLIILVMGRITQITNPVFIAIGLILLRGLTGAYLSFTLTL